MKQTDGFCSATKARALRALACLALLPTSAPAGAQGRQLDPLCALETPRFRVELIKEGRCCPNPLELLYEDRQTGEQRSLRLDARIARSAAMRLVDDTRLLITGRLVPGASSHLAVDLAAGVLQDEILTFDFRLSPSKRRMVYLRYVEPDAPPEARRPILLLYDFTLSATENRAGLPATLDATNAGLPIFPEANAESGSYDPPPEGSHRVLSPFLWSADERRILFVAALGGRGFLVAVDLPTETEGVRIARHPIELHDLLARQAPAERLPYVSLRWKDSDTVELEAVLDGAVGEAVAMAVP